MSLNDIKMPTYLVVGLYSDTLVETEITAHEVQTATEQVVIEQSGNEQTVKKPVIEQPVIEQPVKVQSTIEVTDVPTLNEQQQFEFQGKNQKQILILTVNDKAQYLPEHELKFLTSVLKACGLTTDDVAILNLKNQNATYSELRSFFQNRIALLFGPGPQIIDLPMNFPQFQLQNFDQCTYLHAPALNEIEKEKELKMKLWGCLKNLFSL